MCCFTAAQESSAAKLPIFLQRLQIELQALWVNESKTSTENAFNRDHSATEDFYLGNFDLDFCSVV